MQHSGTTSVGAQRGRRVRRLTRESVVVRIDDPARGFVLLLAAGLRRPSRRLWVAVVVLTGRKSEQLFPDGRPIDDGQQGERQNHS